MVNSQKRRGRRPVIHKLGTFRGSAAALTGDPRAAQLAGRRKARAKANKDAKAKAAAAERALRAGTDLTRHVVMEARVPFGVTYSGRGA
jgi:hypothetical protein